MVYWDYYDTLNTIVYYEQKGMCTKYEAPY